MMNSKGRGRERLESQTLDSRGGLSGFSCDLDGGLPQRHWNRRRGKEQEPQEDWRGSRKMQQSDLELELHPRMGEGVRLGSVA